MSSDSDLTDLSSELSSVRSSLSPPPTFGYPSPSSSQDNGTSHFDTQQGSRKRSLSPPNAPQAKKRRRVEVRPRTTVHLDLRSPQTQPAIDQTPQLHLLLKTLRKRRKIVVIAGAGISTSAGVPDFRSSNGLFNTLKNENKLKASGKHLFDASVYQTDDSTTSFHEMVRTLSRLVAGAKPTAFHEMLATLANEGRLLRLYTQNVDGIDTSLPPLATSVPLNRRGPWPQTIQLHGSLEKMVCSKCNTLKDFDPALFDGPVPPLCLVCQYLDKIRTENAGKRSHGVGRLRPRMVLYNESNPDDEAIGMVSAADLKNRPDAVIVVGTSLEIPGVKRMVRELSKVVRDKRDGVAIWINRGPPPSAKEFENCFDLVVAGDCDTVAHCANMRRWNDEGTDYKECTESEAEKAKRHITQVKVVVKPTETKSPTPPGMVTPKKSSTPAMMMTPAESPKVKATKLPQKPFQLPPLEKQTQADTKKVRNKPSKKAASKPGVTTINISNFSRQPISSGIKGAFKVTKNPPASVPTTFSALPPSPSTPKKPKQGSNGKHFKPHHPSPTGPEKARQLLQSINEPIPMGPLSPHSVKSNGSVLPLESQIQPLKIERMEIPLQIDIPGKSDLTLDGGELRSGEIISPTESTPSGLTSLLQP